jgi:hypothetical protein
MHALSVLDPLPPEVLPGAVDALYPFVYNGPSLVG